MFLCPSDVYTRLMCPVMPQYVKAVIFSYEHGLHFRSCPTTLKLSYSAIHMVYVSGYAPLHENCHLQLYTWFMFPIMPHYMKTVIFSYTRLMCPVMPQYVKAVIFSYAHGLRFRSCPTTGKLSSSAIHTVHVTGYASSCCHLQPYAWFMIPVMPDYVKAVIFSYAHGLHFRSCPTA